MDCAYQDIQLALEILIEAIFNVFHKAAQYLFSPADAVKAMRRWFSSRSMSRQDTSSDQSVAMSRVGDSDPALMEASPSFANMMNTDARTCQDVITELGYGSHNDHAVQHMYIHFHLLNMVFIVLT